MKITLTGPTGPISDVALVDSGADVSAFPWGWAKRLGIQDGRFVSQELDTAGGDGKRWTYQDGRFELEVLGEKLEIEGVFTHTSIALLGRDDVFERFSVTFDQPRERFRMDVYGDAGA